MATISINDFQVITGTGAEDYILLSYNGGQGGKIAIGTFKAQMTPSIKDGKWWIGGVDTNVTAQGTNGKTPIFRRGGSGIEYSYEGENSWNLLVPYSELKLNFDDLTEEQKSQLKMTLDDLSAEDIALLQKPATDMIDELESTNEEMQSAKDDAQDTADHPTYVGVDYYVYQWNKGTKAYDKTSIYVKGEQGEKGEKGDKGDKGANGDGSGNVLVATNGLVSGKTYLFKPNDNDSAEGTFVEYEIPEIDTSELATKNEVEKKQDALISGTNIKTINGESVLGKGDIVTKVQIVDHGTDDTTFTLTPNVLHKWSEVSSLTLSLSSASNEAVVNYYMIEFVSGATPTSLAMPDSIAWASDLTIEANKTYQISILNGCGVIGGF